MVSKELAKVYRPLVVRLLMLWVELSFRLKGRSMVKPHMLGSELIVTLTSYPARFKYLHLTLKCLLNQTTKIDRVILWVAYEDMKQLPKTVTSLVESGLEIRPTADIRSYKKIIPSLKENFNASYIIVDDDLFYPKDWIDNLLTTATKFPGSVVAGRIHEITFNKEGEITPYKQWKWNSLNQSGLNNFFTGCGAVYFPSGAFSHEVLNQDAFIELAPFADDIWLNWMLKKNGTPVVAADKHFKFYDWPGSQIVSLHSQNVKKFGNDKQIKNVISRYGQLYYR